MTAELFCWWRGHLSALIMLLDQQQLFIMGLKRHQYSRRCNVLLLTTSRVSYWNCLVWFYLHGELLSPVTSKTLCGPFLGRMFNKLSLRANLVSCMFIVCVHEQRKRDVIDGAWCASWQQVRTERPLHSCGPRSKESYSCRDLELWSDGAKFYFYFWF